MSATVKSYEQTHIPGISISTIWHWGLPFLGINAWAWKVMGESTWFYNHIIFQFNTRVFWVLLLSDTHKPGTNHQMPISMPFSIGEQMLSHQLCQESWCWDYISAPVPSLSDWPNQMMKEVGSQISPRLVEWLVIWGSKEIWLRHSNFL